MGTITGVDLEVLERIGGTATDVHRAIVRATGRVVVVKRAVWGDTDAGDGLAREAGVLSRISHHHLVRLLAATEDDLGRLVVLEHAPGGSLAARVSNGPLAPADVAELGAGVARALAALHREGVVHRDVHPGNILFDAELRPLLADLDHALDPLGDPLPRDTEAVGHPDHVDLDAPPAPEPAADLAGLASTLWTAATGTPPGRRGHDEPLPLHHGVPAQLHAVLQRLRRGSIEAAVAAAELDVVALELTGCPASGAPTAPRPGTAPRALAAVPERGTTRWAPTTAPRPVAVDPRPPGSDRASRWRRAAVVVVAVVAGLVAAASWLGTVHTTPVPVVAPAPCTTTAVPDDGVLADLDGDGCSEVLVLRDGVLWAAGGRWSLGEPGDVLLAGDWDGDGRWSPGLHRPATRAVYLFDDLPDDGRLTSRPVTVLPPDSRPVVVGDGATHRVAPVP